MVQSTPPVCDISNKKAAARLLAYLLVVRQWRTATNEWRLVMRRELKWKQFVCRTIIGMLTDLSPLGGLISSRRVSRLVAHWSFQIGRRAREASSSSRRGSMVNKSWSCCCVTY